MFLFHHTQPLNMAAIHALLSSQDEFTVYERFRRTAARRHIFLLDQRLIITKEKDSAGVYTYKDSLKIHSLSIAEREGDNPCRFAVGTSPMGKIDSWDQYYILEASTPEKKNEWVDALKDILKQQFALLEGGCGQDIPSRGTVQLLILHSTSCMADFYGFHNMCRSQGSYS